MFDHFERLAIKGLKNQLIKEKVHRRILFYFHYLVVHKQKKTISSLNWLILKRLFLRFQFQVALSYLRCSIQIIFLCSLLSLSLLRRGNYRGWFGQHGPCFNTNTWPRFLNTPLSFRFSLKVSKVWPSVWKSRQSI